MEAPWTTAAQVEQDLILSRAVVSMFTDPEISRHLAFRAGTALYKLHIRPSARYSEGIDLVQITAGPIGDLLDAIRRTLDPWLGTPRRTALVLEPLGFLRRPDSNACSPLFALPEG